MATTEDPNPTTDSRSPEAIANDRHHPTNRSAVEGPFKSGAKSADTAVDPVSYVAKILPGAEPPVAQQPQRPAGRRNQGRQR